MFSGNSNGFFELRSDNCHPSISIVSDPVFSISTNSSLIGVSSPIPIGIARIARWWVCEDLVDYDSRFGIQKSVQKKSIPDITIPKPVSQHIGLPQYFLNHDICKSRARIWKIIARGIKSVSYAPERLYDQIAREYESFNFSAMDGSKFSIKIPGHQSDRGLFFLDVYRKRLLLLLMRIKYLPHPGRLLRACRRDDRRSTRHCGMFPA